MQEKRRYKIHEDGFAELHASEDVLHFFQNNDVVGKTVKCADLYMIYHGFYSVYGSEYGDFEAECHGLKLKMVFQGECPTYFVCKFIDGTYLTVDYRESECAFMKYGKDLTMPDTDIRYIPSVLCGHVFDNLKGEKLINVTISDESGLAGDEEAGVGSVSSLKQLYLDFTNAKTKCRDGNEIHRDSVGFCAYYPDIPVISFYTDRDIPCAENRNDSNVYEAAVIVAEG